MTSLHTSEKAITMRQPATANFLVASPDRVYTSWASPFRFQISSPNSLMNGFFTRIAVAEVALNWTVPNIRTGVNDTFSITDTNGTKTVTMAQGCYTFKQAMDQLVILLNAAGTASTWSVSGTGPTFSLNSTAAATLNSTVLCTQLGLVYGVSGTAAYVGSNPVLLNDLYIDFVCTVLTNQQRLKDASTGANNGQGGSTLGNNYVRDVLCRWYFAYDDSPPTLDAYGFPILMGYTGFYARRTFPFPKQIRWESNIPIGNIVFEVFNDAGNLLPTNLAEANVGTEWFMTLLVSED